MKTVRDDFGFNIQTEGWDWQFGSHLVPYVYPWRTEMPKNECAFSDILIMNKVMIIVYPLVGIS